VKFSLLVNKNNLKLLIEMENFQSYTLACSLIETATDGTRPGTSAAPARTARNQQSPT